MGKAFQRITYKFPTKTFSAGGQDQLSFRDLPSTFNGRYCHLEKIVFEVQMTPTFGGGNNPTVRGHNAIVDSLEVFDGKDLRLTGIGGFNLLRTLERMRTGRVRVADPDTDLASATARRFSRVWHVGPTQFVGSPSDFVIPCSMLHNGEVRMTYGTLARIGTGLGGGGDPSACTGTINAVASIVLLDKIRIPPMYEVRTQAINGADDKIAGQCLLEMLALWNSNTFDAWTAGDLAELTVDAGFGNFIQANARMLAAMYADDFAPGESNGGFIGEPLSANDDNHKQVNRASPTALVGGDADLQPVVWSPPASRISKLTPVRNTLRVSWSGSQTTGTQAVIGRILPQDDQMLGVQYSRIVGKDGRNAKSMAVDTESKEVYRGAFPHYMPVKAYEG